MLYQKTLVVDGLTPVGAYASLRREAGAGSFLLESVVPGERWGRYSILGVRPEVQRVVRQEPGVDPFDALARELPLPATASGSVAASFATAHVGVIAYDIVHGAHRVRPWPGEDPVVARWLCGASVVVFDGLRHEATIAAHSAGELRRIEEALAAVTSLAPLPSPDPGAQPAGLEVEVADEEYAACVEAAKEWIRSGDAFQIVPARTFTVPAGTTDAFDVYRALRVLSPAPYMYYLELPAAGGAPALRVAGASPETLVRVQQGKVTLRPIAGTRRRGETPEADAALVEELLADPKEMAEHVMLIDLARNDVGRIATPGSVRVVERFLVERYSHVMHIVSEVEGRLAPGLGPWEVIRACFPAGTLTGAPKVRAMQLIRELERRPRGVYGGAVGYVTGGAGLDLAIAIRTVVEREGRFEVTAGAGVVADSSGPLEAEETRNKARAALAAIAAAQGR